MRGKAERHALLLGLGLSALAHLLLVVLNPALDVASPQEQPRPRSAPPGHVLIVLELPGTGGAAAPVARSDRASEPAETDSTPGGVAGITSPPLAATTGTVRGAYRSAAERLLVPRDPSLWARPKPRVESNQERAVRETLERLAKASEEPGFTPAEPSPLAPPGGGFGIRIPFGRKPPPRAQVVPAPARLAALPVDSVRPHGDVLRLYYGSYTLTLPARVRAGVPFQLLAELPSPARNATVRIFIDQVARGTYQTAGGSAHATIRVEAAGEHRVLVHILGDAGDQPVELVHVLAVDS